MAMVGTDDEATIETAIVAKYRASPQFKRAWKIISPRPEHSAECEREIVYAIRSVLVAKVDDRTSPAKAKKKLGQGAKKLRAAIPFVLGPSLAEGLKREAKFMEGRADKIVVGKGKPRLSVAKFHAVVGARDLLTRFGSKRPTRYRTGAWHDLSKALFGKAKDLFDYVEKCDAQPRERSRAFLVDVYIVGQRPRFF